MKWTLIATLVLFAVVALWASVPVDATATGHSATPVARIGLCGRWSRELRAQPNREFMLHAMGCSKPYAQWQRATGHCEVIAYHYAATRTSGDFDYSAIGRRGCMLYEDGSWELSSTTA